MTRKYPFWETKTHQDKTRIFSNFKKIDLLDFFRIDRTWRQVRSFIEIYDNFLLGSDAASAKLLRSAFPADNPIGIKVRNHH